MHRTFSLLVRAWSVLLCLIALAAGASPAAIAPETGWWAQSQLGGQPMFVERSGNHMFFAALRYDERGQPVWALGRGRMSCSWNFHGPLSAYGHGQTLNGPYRPAVALPSPGNVLLSFTGNREGGVASGAGTGPMVRLDIGGREPATGAAFVPEAGWWWNPDESGRFFAIEVRNGAMMIAVLGYDAGGAPSWLLSSNAMAAPALYQGNWTRYTDVLSADGAFRTAAASAIEGPVTVRFTDARNAQLTLPNGRDIKITRLRFAPEVAGPQLVMPIRPEDMANTAFGLVPYGVHVGDHGKDGHPGWDIEYRPGATVLSPLTGFISQVYGGRTGETGLGISPKGNEKYRVDIGVGTPLPGIVKGASVVAGQPLGTLTVYQRWIGNRPVTYSMSHVQFDDMSYMVGLTNTFAKPIEDQLSDEGRRAFDAIWRQSSYTQEVCEPNPTNPRSSATEIYPKPRHWKAFRNGQLAASIEYSCDVGRNAYRYTFRDERGAVFETGSVTLQTAGVTPSTVTFTPDSALRRGTRRGVYDVSCNVMSLDYGDPGSSGPGNLTRAEIYVTD